MAIVKFCSKNHHISTTKTIKIGTLNYYKKTDNHFIKDSLEGYYEHVIESNEKEIIFKDNQEYRFAWIPLDKNGFIVEVDDNPIYIRTNPFSFVACG